MKKNLSTIYKLAIIFGATFIFVYGGYYLYLATNSLGGSSKQEFAILEIGKALIDTGIERQYDSFDKKRISMGLVGVPSPDNCNFWSFEYVIGNCRFISLSVINFEESERSKLINLVDHTAILLANPCKHIHLLKTERQSRVTSELGCGEPKFTYRMILQTRASELVKDPNGGSYYINRLIYSKSIRGEIE